MTAGRQALFWAGAAVLFAILIELFRPILLPFVVGMAVAYFLDPVTDRVESLGMSRAAATALVLTAFFGIAVVLLLLLLPLVQGQLTAFAERVPDIVTGLRARLLPLVERLTAGISPDQAERLRTAAGNYAGEVLAWLAGLLGDLWSGGIAFLNLLSLIIVTPVVAFYLLRDWDRLVAQIDGWLPRAHVEVIRGQLQEIDRTLAGYVRGATMVVLILTAFYAVALTVIGLDFGLIVGLIAGLISFIPFAGAVVGFVLATALALFQFSDWLPVALVVGTFALGQAVEGNFLTPRLVGERIGLHPVWVLFALFAGGALFGFVGLLLAVPVAAVIGVLSRYGIARYLESPLYLGPAAAPGGGPPAGGSARDSARDTGGGESGSVS